jgi:hypothetical protein
MSEELLFRMITLFVPFALLLGFVYGMLRMLDDKPLIPKIKLIRKRYSKKTLEQLR